MLVASYADGRRVEAASVRSCDGRIDIGNDETNLDFVATKGSRGVNFPRIGALPRRTGVKIETIRYYEKIGLLKAPPRTGNNYRIYQGMNVARLGFIRRARGLGFSIDQIDTLLDLASQHDGSCERVSSES